MLSTPPAGLSRIVLLGKLVAALLLPVLIGALAAGACARYSTTAEAVGGDLVPLSVTSGQVCTAQDQPCRPAVLVSGTLENNALDRVEPVVRDTIKAHAGQRVALCFASGGGRYAQGMQLRYLAQHYDLDTCIARVPGLDAVSAEHVAADGGRRTATGLLGVCASSCTVAFLGGQHRSIDVSAQYIVHRMFARADPSSAPWWLCSICHVGNVFAGSVAWFNDAVGSLSSRPDILYVGNATWHMPTLAPRALGHEQMLAEGVIHAESSLVWHPAGSAKPAPIQAR